METTYHIHTRNLDSEFLNTLQEDFPDRVIEVTVREVDPYTLDADAYLRLDKAYSKHLDEVIEKFRHREDFIPIDTPEDLDAYTRDPAGYIARKKAEWSAEKKPAPALLTEAAAS